MTTMRKPASNTSSSSSIKKQWCHPHLLMAVLVLLMSMISMCSSASSSPIAVVGSSAHQHQQQQQQHPTNTFRRTSASKLPSSISISTTTIRTIRGGATGVTTTIRTRPPAPPPPKKAVVTKSPSTTSTTSTNTVGQSIVGIFTLMMIQKSIQAFFVSNSIKFPAMLGGCILLLTTFLLYDVVFSAKKNELVQFLLPGTTLLGKWLPVFFVPGLVLLPLSPSVGSTLEYMKLGFVVVIGFLYVLLSTALSVHGIRIVQGKVIVSPSKATTSKKATAAPALNNNKKKNVVATKAVPPSTPFVQESTWKLLCSSTFIMGMMSIVMTRLDSSSTTVSLPSTVSSLITSMKKPIQTIFLLLASLTTFSYGTKLPPQMSKVIHPLITSSLLLSILLRTMAYITHTNYYDLLRSFRVGSIAPIHNVGAGDILLYLLGPSVVSFAIGIYNRRHLIPSNALVIVWTMLLSSIGGLFGTAAIVRCIALGGNALTNKNSKIIRLSLLSRSVTTALAMIITGILGGDPPITAGVVSMTGVLGASFGKNILSYFGVEDPISRGLAVGAAAQGLGVASIMDEPDAFPFGAISMVLSAICATTLVSIPTIRDALIQLAIGGK